MSILPAGLLVLIALGGSTSDAAARPRDGSTLRGAAAFQPCGACHSVAPGVQAVAAGQAPPPARGGMMAGPARADLKTLGAERRVTAIRHCGDGYHVTTGDGRTVPFWEFNLRFKTDSSQLGPSPGKPALVRAGMQGDRGSVVFSSPAEISRFIEVRC